MKGLRLSFAVLFDRRFITGICFILLYWIVIFFVYDRKVTPSSGSGFSLEEAYAKFTSIAMVAIVFCPCYALSLSGLTRQSFSPISVIRLGRRSGSVSRFALIIIVRSLVFSAALALPALALAHTLPLSNSSLGTVALFTLAVIPMQAAFFTVVGILMLAACLWLGDGMYPIAAAMVYGSIDYVLGFVRLSDQLVFRTGWLLTWIESLQGLPATILGSLRLVAFAIALCIVCVMLVERNDLGESWREGNG